MTLNVDNTFEKWKNLRDEIRRTSLGKYLGNKNEFNLTSVVPIYSGNLDCKRKFNYLLESNRCLPCTAISCLHDDDSNTNPILIQVGKNRNKKIIVEEFPKQNNPFGSYREFKYNFDKLSLKLAPIKEMVDVLNNERDKKIFINTDSTISHSVVISEMANYYMFIETNILSCHVCNSIKLVKWYNDDILLNAMTLSSYDVISILIQLMLPTLDNIYSVGNIDIKRLSFVNSQSIFKYSDKNYKLSKVVRLNPDKDSYIFCNGYGDKKLKFLGSSVENINYDELPFVPADIRLGSKPDRMIPFGNPTLREFEKIASVTIRPTKQLFDFEAKTSISPCKHMHGYLWLMTLLCEKNFFDVFTSNHNQILNIMFYTEDINPLLAAVSTWHNFRSPSYQEIKEMAIGLRFSTRFGIHSLLSSYLVQNLQAE